MDIEDPRYQRLAREYVSPVYNRVDTNEWLAPTVAAMGRSISLDDLLFLLESGWRERQMAGWFSLLRDEPTVRQAVLDSIRTSSSTQATTVLTVAAILLAQQDAVPTLTEKRAADAQYPWGSAPFIDIALDFLTNKTPRGDSATDGRSQFDRLLATAHRIRDADTEIKGSRRAVLTELPGESEFRPISAIDGSRSFVVKPINKDRYFGCITTILMKRDESKTPDMVVNLEFWDASALDALQPDSDFHILYGPEEGRGRVSS